MGKKKLHKEVTKRQHQFCPFCFRLYLFEVVEDPGDPPHLEPEGDACPPLSILRLAGVTMPIPGTMSRLGPSLLLMFS